jgi:hypothetical protein
MMPFRRVDAARRSETLRGWLGRPPVWVLLQVLLRSAVAVLPLGETATRSKTGPLRRKRLRGTSL